MIGAAEDLGERGIGFAKTEADRFLQDPISYFIGTTRKIGVGMLATGTVLGVAAYYMKASATAAMKNELSVISNLGTMFSNIRAPTFSPSSTSTYPLSASVQGVQNFFADAWGDVQAAAADVAQTGAILGTLGEDVAIGIVDLAKSFLASVMHFPDILWNGLVWGIGGAIADVLTWAFPWLILFGGMLLIASMIAWGARALWEISGERLIRRIKLSANARSARRWNAYDRGYGTRRKIEEVWTQKGTESMIHSANARFLAPETRPPSKERLDRVGVDSSGKPDPVPFSAIVGQTADNGKAPPSPPEGPERPPDRPEAESPAPAEAPAVVAPTEAPAQTPKTPEQLAAELQGAADYAKHEAALQEREAELQRAQEALRKPIPGGTPTADVERLLGDPDALEPTAEEIREMEKNRIASMLPADRAVAEENREALAGATTASKADDIVEV